MTKRTVLFAQRACSSAFRTAIEAANSPVYFLTNASLYCRARFPVCNPRDGLRVGIWCLRPRAAGHLRLQPIQNLVIPEPLQAVKVSVEARELARAQTTQLHCECSCRRGSQQYPRIPAGELSDWLLSRSQCWFVPHLYGGCPECSAPISRYLVLIVSGRPGAGQPT